MTRPYVRLLTLALLGSGLAPLAAWIASLCLVQGLGLGAFTRERIFALAGLVTLAIAAAAAAYALLRKLEPRLDACCREQVEFLDALPTGRVGLAIFASAALGLHLELAVLRWQATVFEVFAFHKNLSLLSCFAGLGLGYVLGNRSRIPLVLTIPLLAWQFVLLIGMRYGMTEDQQISLKVLPFREQLNMGLSSASEVLHAVQTYLLMGVVFLLTALAFLPIGQVCGALMRRRETLSAYGLNLLGSLAGVVLMLVLSALWTPPTLWFLFALAAIFLFHARDRGSMTFSALSAVVALAVLAWPVDPSWQRIYSPYQLIEIGHTRRGLIVIRAAGYYYQRVHDLSRSNRDLDANERLRAICDYYDFPYRVHGAARRVAVVGAGAGNDVAAALRAGAERVDAIEIDPVIQRAGIDAHPERPYDDPRVRAVVDDARSFLRRSDSTYDLIVYGLLDSHTLLSHASSVRLDSFVYTVEALREARSRLAPGGMLSLSFTLVTQDLGGKLYLMLTEAFDGRPPVCIQAGYDRAVVFLASNDGPVALPPGLLEETGFGDRTAEFAARSLAADVSTDDWPFFYMPRRVYPASHLVMIAVVLALSFLLVGSFSEGRPRPGYAPFFLLGAGFMLVETKGITELGLVFGSSWQVVGVVIAGILIMSFLANQAVQGLGLRSALAPGALLLATLVAGWVVARQGGLPSTWTGKIGATLLVTAPMFFSGLLFSTWLAARADIAGAMAANLFGAMCGGLLEYNSMYFGFGFLYLLAAAIYAAAWLLRVRSS